jgi:hypothetical protein
MDERSERVAKRFERPLLVAAVLTIPVTILQLLPTGDPWREIADVLELGDLAGVFGGASGDGRCRTVEETMAA